MGKSHARYAQSAMQRSPRYLSADDCNRSSPKGFYVYPSAKVIRAPAITQANGQLACTATSSWSLVCPSYSSSVSIEATRETAVFTGINTNIAAYYSGQVGPTTQIQTLASGELTTFPWTRSKVNATAFATTVDISFSTPFLFFPAKGATGK